MTKKDLREMTNEVLLFEIASCKRMVLSKLDCGCYASACDSVRNMQKVDEVLRERGIITYEND